MPGFFLKTFNMFHLYKTNIFFLEHIKEGPLATQVVAYSKDGEVLVGTIAKRQASS